MKWIRFPLPLSWKVTVLRVQGKVDLQMAAKMVPAKGLDRIWGQSDLHDSYLSVLFYVGLVRAMIRGGRNYMGEETCTPQYLHSSLGI